MPRVQSTKSNRDVTLRNTVTICKPNPLTFNQDVYRLVRQIPESKVTSYGAIARLLGFPNHARLVGNALKLLPQEFASPTLPVPPPSPDLTSEELEDYVEPAPEINPDFVPWHRVLSQSGIISPRGNDRAVMRQAEWLQVEGVVVSQTMREGGGTREREGVDAFGLGGMGADGGRVKMKDFAWDEQMQ